ncbi:facilitated trehalose transporter Tret1 [Cephus cinctus]|uniref:Facilitated trehalose transporter Tret1 n=1 Tax=Cephus cinctus TaxID=211228 RepID=A0AAJ7RBH3_CEPCN|nr:facilitated trehalose transporter Tret1 [Cephus cinctus]XP_015589090.1 facilitated trehalose transporter Tret1 [Cephus cinctus]XP_015589091.1 facilitated trehalose transporter Tret1 [Cephus cinctus]XP_024937824.1 facilitated trehalose transporter Tret1 [Cephus cinctus]XP_024937825.1 facilitated trehalose transporter Tret1 [Cephus cinctus]XP_024937826.1 facilitated trehalose transporter Tret1 [Cephus cinctus]XP_024937828.1 facilitated trehalose transporter Tret1 [Cephus cinctus]XP_02493782
MKLPKLNLGLCRQIQIGLVCNLMMLGCGFHEGWSTSMIPKLDGNDPTITVTPDQGSWIINFMYVGVGLTSLIAPIFMEKIGRKWSLLSGTIPLTAGWLLLALGQHHVTLYIGRFLAGLGCGIAYSITPVYIGEISSKKTRGPLGTMTAVLINTGMLIVSVIGLHVSRFTLGIISVWLPIIFALTFVWMPESPLFLARTNRLTEAERALKWSLGKDNVLEELQQIERTISKDKTHTVGILISFKRISERVNRKAFGIIIILLCALSFTGATPILAYQSYIYEEAGFDVSTNASILVTGCAVVIAGICCVCVVKITGKKTLLLIAMPLCAVSLGTIAIFFTFWSYRIDMPNFRWIPTVFVVIFVVAYGLAINPIPLAYAGEIFAPDVKLPAAMFCSIFYSVSTTVVTKLYQVLRETYGTYVPMWTLASLTIVIWIFIYLYVPETEGKTLEDIQKEMAGQDKKPTDASVINS